MNRHSYNAVALEWDAIRTAMSDAEARVFALLCEGLQPAAEVLDLGCGTGRPIAEYLAGLQLQVTGVDQSEKMLELAKLRLPRHDWVHSAIQDYTPTQTFAAAVAWDSLFHIPRAEHCTIFARVRQCLPVAGRFALTVGGSDHAPFTDTMLGQHFFYDSHSPAAAVALLRSIGFEVLHSEFLNLPTGGRDKGRFAIVASAV